MALNVETKEANKTLPQPCNHLEHLALYHVRMDIDLLHEVLECSTNRSSSALRVSLQNCTLDFLSPNSKINLPSAPDLQNERLYGLIRDFLAGLLESGEDHVVIAGLRLQEKREAEDKLKTRGGREHKYNPALDSIV